MTTQESDLTLLNLINISRNYNNIDSGKIILEHWEDYNTIPIPISTHLFGLNGLDNYDDFYLPQYEMYKFLSLLSNMTMLDHIYKIIYVDDIPEVLITCKNLWNSYGKLKKHTIEELMFDLKMKKISQKGVNTFIVDFMEEKLKPLMRYQEVPEWIIEGERNQYELENISNTIIDLRTKKVDISNYE